MQERHCVKNFKFYLILLLENCRLVLWAASASQDAVREHEQRSIVVIPREEVRANKSLLNQVSILFFLPRSMHCYWCNGLF